MNFNKRILVISILLVFIIFLFFITKNYEKKLTVLKQKDTYINYSVFKKQKGFKLENSSRYIKYYQNNKNLSYADIVTRVNIGLDYNFYNFTKQTDTYKNEKVLVNKYLYLNKDYKPYDLENIKDECFINGNNDVKSLRKDAKEAFERLCEDAKKDNVLILGQSGYRSYQRQDILYNDAKERYGIVKADSDTARAGHSEHQTGLAIDVSSTRNGNMLVFEYTPSFIWMKNNAYKYGFILRYPRLKENIHGYIYEPWHYRYVGIDIASDMHNNYNNLTFDEYYFLFLDK